MAIDRPAAEDTRMRLGRGGVVILISVAGVLALWLWATIQDEAGGRTKTAVSASAKAEGDDIRVDFWADDARVAFQDPVRLWVTIVNRTGGTIHLNFAGFRIDGFERTGVCWSDSGAPACRVAGDERKGVVFPIALQKSEAVTLAADVRAGREAGRYGLAAVIAWSASPANLNRHKPISLGPIAVEHPWRSYLAIFLKTLKAVVKDLALPIALGLFAYFLRKREIERESRRQKSEKLRAAEEQKAAEKNARVRETWNQMMMKSHQNAERHYLPIISAGDMVAAYYPRAAAGHADEQVACFFSYLLFLSRMKHMAHSIGGLYLKDRVAEFLLSDIWSYILDWTDAAVTRPLRERCTALIDPDETLNTFLERTFSRRDARKAHELFVAKLPTFRKIATLVEIFDRIFEYEINRAYEFWYETPADLDTVEFVALIDRLIIVPRDAKVDGLKQRLRRYVESAGVVNASRPARDLTFDDAGTTI